MKRPAAYLLLALLMALVPAALAQESHPAEEKGGAEGAGEGPGEGGNLTPWKWANFIVLAGGLGYLIGKNGGPFFAARAGKIRDEMAAAAAQLQEAEKRAAEAERRLAGLQADIAGLKEEARREAEAEARRAAERLEAEIAKIKAHAESEIASAGKAGRLELKQYAARLAVKLAEDKIRSGLSPAAQETLVARFADDLNRPDPKREAN